MSDKDYKNNLESFLTKMQGAFVEKLSFKIDSKPTFDKAVLSFDFQYCFSIVFTVDETNYSLRTAMTSDAVDTFWIETVETTEGYDLVKVIQSKIKAISCENGYNDLPYKMRIEFESFAIDILAAEIYDLADGYYDYKINDEMLLVFESENEAKKFEAVVNLAVD